MADQTAANVDRFRSVYESLYDDIFRYLARRVETVEDADDVLADAFTVVWQRLSDVPPHPATRPWVFGVARNHLRNHARRGGRTVRLQHRMASDALAGTAPSVHADGAEARVAEVRAAMERLPRKDAEVLRLAIWDDLPHREIAQIVSALRTPWRCGCVGPALALAKCWRCPQRTTHRHPRRDPLKETSDE